MGVIPQSNDAEFDLRQMRAFEVLLRERNLTRAAAVLGMSQPALSKKLASLRRYFGDPLFIRVGHRMEPTAKALELETAVRALLDDVTMLKTRHRPFDPRSMRRTFGFSVVDAGMLRLLPPLLRVLTERAPGVGLRVEPLDVERLEASLESGHLDFVMGSFPSLSKRIRRQLLWSVTYVCVARADHPRLGVRPSLKAFAAERHVLVSAAGTGHAHRLAERALEQAIDPSRIVCRVPTFVTAAFVASRTDAVVTVPATMAAELAEPFKLRTFVPPLKMPRIDVSQYWHERFHREPGSEWIRGLFASLFTSPGAGVGAG
jgi:DNA-binding transcriptional LysR family regulator